MSEQDLDAILRRMSESKVNRRGFLAAAGLTGTAAFLAACGASGGVSRTESAAPASAAPSAAPVGRGVGRGLRGSVRGGFPAATATLESELLMYNWSNYISDKNIEEFKAEYGVSKFQYDIYDNNDVLMAKLPGRRHRLRHRRTDQRTTSRRWSQGASCRSST